MSGETGLLRWLAVAVVLSLLVVACGSPSGSATTTTTVSLSTVADQSTLETVQPSSTSQPTDPPASTTTAAPTPTTTTAQASKTVAASIVSFAFNPNSITINVGDTIKWTNNDPVDHTSTSGGNWDSGSLAFGVSFSEVFDSAGTFNYFCSIHPSMTATVVVNP